MTGYGEAISTQGRIAVVARIKSINARFLDLRVNAPEILAELETEVSNSVKSAITRGTVSVTIELAPGDKTDLFDVVLDEKLLEKYLSAMKQAVSEELVLTPRDIVALPDVMTIRPKQDLARLLAPSVIAAVSEAAANLVAMREREGLSIYNDLAGRLDRISLFVDDLEQRKDECRTRNFDSLKQRICELVEGQMELSEERIAQEAALFSCKADPTEELTRLKSHIAQFRTALDEPQSVGSKLKFLLQECNREADTIGAKGADLETSNLVIAIKEEFERIREQIANVE